MTQIVDDPRFRLGQDATSVALRVCRTRYYRSRPQGAYGPRYEIRSPGSLFPEEQREVFDVLHDDRFRRPCMVTTVSVAWSLALVY